MPSDKKGAEDFTKGERSGLVWVFTEILGSKLTEPYQIEHAINNRLMVLDIKIESGDYE